MPGMAVYGARRYLHAGFTARRVAIPLCSHVQPGTLTLVGDHSTGIDRKQLACRRTALEPLRVGYIGCGFMAQRVHLPNFAAMPEVTLLALAELRPELGPQVRQRFGIPRLYRDHQELLADPDIEAVAVSAAFAVQGELARQALLAGKDVFMEKPMAISLVQADAILEAERESGKRLMVGYMKRYDAGNELVKSLIDAVRRHRASSAP